MTRSDAIRQLDAWLLVPVDYEKILPALYALQGDREYGSYIAKVAEAEFRKPSDIQADVDQFALRCPDIEARSSALDQKLEAISGIKNRSVSEAFASDNEDVFEGLTNHINRKYDAEAQEADKLNNAFNKYVKGYRGNSSPGSALVPTCRHCNHELCNRVVQKTSDSKMMWIIIAFIVFWPLGLYMLFTSRKSVSQQYCPRCGAIYSERELY